MGQWFGTDGVRGVANTELTPELALQLGRAGAAVLAGATTGKRPKLLVARDPRLSGPMLEAALVAGILSAGADVTLLGVATTPAVAYLVRRAGADAGAIISASHNPAEYNGIKFFSADGYKLPDAVEAQIEALLRRSAVDAPRPDGAHVGRVERQPEHVEEYLNHLLATLPAPLTGLRLVVDCAHGAASELAPALFRRAGAEVTVIAASPDGLNINAGVGSLHPEALMAKVLEVGAQAGLAFDGDADRCLAVDEHGQLLDGDAILAIAGVYLIERQQLPGMTVVATVMSNGGLDLLLQRYGARLVRTKVGDRYVLEAMLKGGYDLGGEQSGHVIFRRHSTTGDGLLTGLQLLGIAARRGRPLSQLAAELPRLPQVHRNVAVARRQDVGEDLRVRQAVRLAETRLGRGGRVLVRPSGTEPLVRVLVEGDSEPLVERVADDLVDVIATVGGAIKKEG